MSNLCDNPMGSKGSKGPKGLMGFELVKFAFPTPGALEPGFERMGFSLAATHHTQDVAPYRQGHTNFFFNREPTNVAGLFAAEHAPCTRGMASRTRNSYDCSDTTVDPQRVRRVLSTLRLRCTNTAPLDRSFLMKYVSKLTACLVFTCAAVLPTIANAIVDPLTIIEAPRYPAPTGNECERTGITIPETGPIVVRDNYGGSTLLMVQCRDIILELGRPVVLGGEHLVVADVSAHASNQLCRVRCGFCFPRITTQIHWPITGKKYCRHLPHGFPPPPGTKFCRQLEQQTLHICSRVRVGTVRCACMRPSQLKSRSTRC